MTRIAISPLNDFGEIIEMSELAIMKEGVQRIKDGEEPSEVSRELAEVLSSLVNLELSSREWREKAVAVTFPDVPENLLPADMKTELEGSFNVNKLPKLLRKILDKGVKGATDDQEAALSKAADSVRIHLGQLEQVMK